MKRYLNCEGWRIELHLCLDLTAMAPLGLQTHLCKHSTPGISPMHLSKHNYGRLQFFCSQDRIRTCMITYEQDFYRVFQGYSALSLLLTFIHASTIPPPDYIILIPSNHTLINL